MWCGEKEMNGEDGEEFRGKPLVVVGPHLEVKFV